MARKIKIMLVEDEVYIAMHLSMALKKAGHDVSGIISKGNDAIEKARSEKPDLILMDVNLIGEMDGIDASRIILSRQKPKILLMTGYHSADYSQRLEDLDIAGILTKPVDVKKIIKFINQNFQEK